MRINIQYKITLLFSLISAIILAGVFIYLMNHLNEQAYVKIKTNLKNDINLAGNYLEKQYPQKKSIPKIDAIADAIGKDLKVRVTIIDLKGKVLGDSDLGASEVEGVDSHLYRPEIQQAMKSGYGESRRFSQTIHKEFLYMASPFSITANSKNDGIIRLSVPLSEIEQSSRQLMRILFISLGVAFLLSLLLGFGGSQVISNPIKEVSSLSKSMAAGDFSRLVSIHSNDELGDLSTSVNYMSKQIKERIEEVVTSRLRLEAVLQSMFDGVVVVDADGKILLMNKALRTLLQLTDEVVGKKPIEVIRNIEIQEIVSKILKGQSGSISQEISALFAEEKNLIIHATPVTLNDQNDGVVMVFHDITELRRLETIRKDFVANVSHELRTPITNIKGYAETLIEGAIDDKKNAEDFIKVISTESERLAKLVEDVLDLSRIESGKIEFDFRAYDIGEIIDRVEKGLSKQMQRKKIVFTKKIPEKLPKVNCDAPSIAQVLLNLIENAVKYNQDDGVVTLEAVEKGDFIEISISDTGIGIPEEDLPRIFERFYRVDKAHSREIGGTGLGLSIVKHIIQAHRGDVHVTSQLEVGSTFRFTLPKYSEFEL